MEFAPRPFVRPTSATSFHPLHILHSSSSTSTAPPPALPIPRPSTSFGQLSDYRLRSDIRIVEEGSSRRLEQGGLWENSTARPPPPRSYSLSPPQPPLPSDCRLRTNTRSATEEGAKRQQELDVFWKNSLTRLPSPPGAQPIPTRRRTSSCRMGATMTVPPTINSTNGAMADFAAQVQPTQPTTYAPPR